MSVVTVRGFRIVSAAAAVFVIAVVVSASVGILPANARQAIDDCGQIVTGASAASACWWTARGVTGADRRWRIWMTAGMGSWTCGQVVWTYYQDLMSTPTPSPSLADAGYLLMPAFALVALLTFPTERRRRIVHDDPDAEARSPLIFVLDSLTLVSALLVIAWSTGLGAVVHAGAPSLPKFVIAIAYPLTDLVLVFTVIFTAVLGRARDLRVLGLVGLGLVGIAMSDTSYAYLVSIGAGSIKPLSDAGFVAGPALIALAAVIPTGPPEAPPAGPVSRPALPRSRRPVWTAWALLLLPYVPLLVAGILVFRQTVGDVDRVVIYTGFVMVTLVVVRQFETLRINRHLLQRVRAAQDELLHQAFHDPLTGLANRALFADRLAHSLAVGRRERRPTALLFCDLDDFKVVNDSLGHAAGDQLLRVVADRLRRCVRTSDTVARLGGDEFAVILTSGPEMPEAIGERVLAAFREPAVIGGRHYPLRASVGLVVARSDGPAETVEALLRRSDAAMYAAKHRGKDRLVIYRPGMPTPGVDLELTDDLAAALRGGGSSAIDVHYQPIVRLAGRAVVALEALARWKHPVRGLVPTQTFITAAEDVGLIGELDDAVLNRACTDVARMSWAVSAGLRLHVNVSASRLTGTSLHASVVAALASSGLPATSLVIEITETSRIADLDGAEAILTAIRRLGVGIALDDVGAGYSTLAALHHLPVDVVKLDRSLVAGAGNTGRVAALRRSMINVARSIGAVVIAEGIENNSQIADLTLLGCEYGQANLFSPAAPLSQLDLPGPVGPPRTPDLPVAVPKPASDGDRLAAPHSG